MPSLAESTSQVTLDVLEATLLNKSGTVNLHNRFRALFTLKAVGDDRAIGIISKCFEDDSALLKHELAYCLGQTKQEAALPTLEHVLTNPREDPMVRHEAAEAMGAISSPTSLPILRQHLSDPERAVRETCEIAIAKIEFDNSEEGRAFHDSQKASPSYTSIDPAPPSAPEDPHTHTPSLQQAETANIASLRTTLLDTTQPLFSRYRAMFALRNIGTDEAVDALAEGFHDDSVLFKHEIAFVFGQLSSPHSIPSLLSILQNNAEEDMVRHEAAEALGGIATPEVLPYLKEWNKRKDAPRVVRESCEVALDMWEYENSDQFQYADGIVASEDHAVSVAA